MKYLSIALALSFSLLPCHAATAQEAPPPDIPDFSVERLDGDREGPRRPSTQRIIIPAGLLYASFDTNGDYAASRTELNAGILRSFATADKNANDMVSLVELAAWREAILGSRDLPPGNTQFDKNFNGQIEPSEFKTVLEDLFEAFDRNENGQLEFAEMTRDARSTRGGENGQSRARPQGGQQRPQRGQRPQR